MCLQRPLPFNIVESWSLQLVSAMNDLSRLNLAHNDLKPVSGRAMLVIPPGTMLLNVASLLCLPPAGLLPVSHCTHNS